MHSNEAMVVVETKKFGPENAEMMNASVSRIVHGCRFRHPFLSPSLSRSLARSAAVVLL